MQAQSGGGEAACGGTETGPGAVAAVTLAILPGRQLPCRWRYCRGEQPMSRRKAAEKCSMEE